MSKPKRFEIVYDDMKVVRGSTAKQFEKASAAGILFVIVEFHDGHIEKWKGLGCYIYRGMQQPGSWTTDSNYQKVKDSLPRLSVLL